MDFRDRLRDQIDFLGLKDKEVAARAGITKRAIDMYVGARACMPAADVAVRLAKVLGVSVEYLVAGAKPVRTNEPLPDQRPPDERSRRLLRRYAELSERDQEVLLSLADRLATL